MRIGREVKKDVDMKAVHRLVTESRRGNVRPAVSGEQKDAIIKGIMTLPSGKRVAALRSYGFDDEANALEHEMAQKHLAELRDAKLKEIMALPETERLSQLIANGFDDEAKALSEQLAKANNSEESAEKTENTESEGDSVEKPEKPVKKRGGRKKKSE